MDTALLFLVGGYAIGLLILTIAFIRYQPRLSKEKPFVSIVVAARNEAKNIAACLKALLDQNYEPDRYEVIVVNDRSEDETASILSRFSDQRIRLIVVKDKMPGIAPKKYALTRGIEASKGEILLFTDADCRPESSWIVTTVALYDDQTGMVIGYSPIQPEKWFDLRGAFLSLDSLALAVATVASTAMGKPWTATGRNLSYRKRTFEEVGGFQRIAGFLSGDDDLFLQLVKKTRWRFAYNTRSSVRTCPPVGWSAFFNQKTRQFSKIKHYGWVALSLFILYYTMNALLVAGSILAMTGAGHFWVSMAWSIKLSAEILFLAAGGFRFKNLRQMFYFPLFAFFYPLYIIGFGLWAQFGRFEWKGSRSV